jgi:short-subunit dehydrogenase
MARREIADKIAIVTGASSGIGRAIALELARQGAHLVLTARCEDRLREVAAAIDSWRIANPPYKAASVVVAAGDVTDPATRHRVIQAAVSRFGGLDILVNNAGVGALGRFEDADPGRLRQIMDVNFFAAVELTRLALRPLKRAQSAIVVNVGSVLGHRAIPGRSEYCASKFALRGFSEALRAELARDEIDVLLVSPGTTRTEFFDHLVERKGEPTWRNWGEVTAEYVARKTVQAIRRGDHEVIPSTLGRLLCLVNRLFPRLVDDVLGGHA